MSVRAYRTLKVGAEILVPIAILAAWQLWTAQADSQYFPKLSTILVEFRELWLFAQFDEHVVPSLVRIGLGFGIAALVGVALGVPIGLSQWTRKLAMPHIEYWRAMPPPALLPISIVLLHDIGNKQKVSFIAFFCLFPILLNTIDGVRRVDPVLLNTARTFRLRRLKTIWQVVLPAASPQIMTGLRVSLPIMLILVVISEMVGSTDGIGYFILDSQRRFRVAQMYAGMAALAILGYTLNQFFNLLHRRLLSWHWGMMRRKDEG